MAEKIEFRCACCGKLLAKTNGDTDIKCPRCGSMNYFNAASGDVKYTPKLRKERTHSSGVVFR